MMLWDTSFTLDVGELHEHPDTKTFKEILGSAGKIAHVVYNRTTALLEEKPSDVESHVLRYCPEDVRQLLVKKRGDGYRPWLSVLFLELIYCATRYDISCSKLLFNSEIPIVPPRKVCAMLKMAEQLPPSVLRGIRLRLDWNRLETKNVPYIIKYRYAELAAEQGRSFPDFLRQSFGADGAGYNIEQEQFLNSSIKETDTERQEYGDQFLGTMPLFRKLLLICIACYVAPDRILLQDYSANAVAMDGTPFTTEQKKLLSSFLCATPMAQTMAIQEIVLSAFPDNDAVSE